MSRIFSPDSLSRKIAESLDADVDSWSADEHRVWSGEFKIWIANGPFALNAAVDGVGEFYAPCFPIGGPSQRHIWRAFKRWQRRRLAAALPAAERTKVDRQQPATNE